MQKFRWIPKVIAVVCVLGIAGLITYLATHNTRKLLYEELTADEIVEWSMDAYEEAIVQTEDQLNLAHMKKIASNGGSTLYFHEQTCELAIQTSDGTVWHTNPQNRLEFNGTAQLNFSSQLQLNIITSEEVTKTLYSFNDAVQYGQFVTQEIEDGIRVEYRFGRLRKIRTYPEGLTEERFNEICSQLSASEQKKLQQYYTRIDYNVTDKTQLKTVLEKYTKLPELGVVYVLKSNPSTLIQKNLINYFSKVGYTMEIREQDHEAVGYDEALSTTNNVMVPVEYTLKDGVFRARVVSDQIKAVEGVKIQSIELLPYMSNGEIDSTELLVPDGEGALMRFGTIVSSSTSDYEETVYGVDNSVYKSGSISNRQTLSFPFYGMMNKAGALYAVIEEGEASASLKITPRTGTLAYGTVGYKFKTLDYANIKLMEDDTDTVRSYADKASLSPIQVAYRFLPASQSSWIDVATEYRNLLKAEGKLPELSTDQVPTVLSLIGAIDDIEPFLGVPREVIVSLTSYEQAGQIAQEMQSAISDSQLAVRYLGWQEGGLMSPVANKLRLESELGSKSDMKALQELCNNLGIDLFPDVDFQYVYRTKWFDGFSTSDDAARFVISETAYRATYNMANFLADPDKLFGMVVNPNSMVSFAEDYIPDATDFGLSGLSLAYIGKELNSDFDRDHFVTRTESQALTEQVLQMVDESGLKSMTTGANLYSLKYMDYTVNIAMQSNAHPLLERTVPVTQMLLSGKVAYTADPINNAANTEYYMLKCIETGSGVYADLIAEDNSLVKGTKYDAYYAVNYDNVKEDVVRVANEVSKALKPVYGQEMVNYEVLEEGFVRVSYANGQAILVNYNTEAKTAATGETVEAMGYLNTTWR